VIDELTFNGLTDGTLLPDGAGTDFPSVTGFAIVAAVPDPSSITLMLGGIGVLLLVLRMRQNRLN